jgi:hypothetical protein
MSHDLTNHNKIIANILLAQYYTTKLMLVTQLTSTAMQ